LSIRSIFFNQVSFEFINKVGFENVLHVKLIDGTVSTIELTLQQQQNEVEFDILFVRIPNVKKTPTNFDHRELEMIVTMPPSERIAFNGWRGSMFLEEKMKINLTILMQRKPSSFGPKAEVSSTRS
jgi:hypothetical protein